MTTGTAPRLPAGPLRLTALSGRRAFAALRAGAHRGRSGPVTVVAAPDGTLDVAAVAYAIRTTAGTAVARNRLRRRARALLARWAAAGTLPAGRYLVSFAAPLDRLDGPALAIHLRRAVEAATRGR